MPLERAPGISFYVIQRASKTRYHLLQRNSGDKNKWNCLLQSGSGFLLASLSRNKIAWGSLFSSGGLGHTEDMCSFGCFPDTLSCSFPIQAGSQGHTLNTGARFSGAHPKYGTRFRFGRWDGTVPTDSGLSPWYLLDLDSLKSSHKFTVL